MTLFLDSFMQHMPNICVGFTLCSEKQRTVASFFAARKSIKGTLQTHHGGITTRRHLAIVRKLGIHKGVTPGKNENIIWLERCTAAQEKPVTSAAVVKLGVVISLLKHLKCTYRPQSNEC